MKIGDITENFRQPTVMFHGTSSIFLRSIMVNGLQPNPEKRTWETDPNTSMASVSRVSLEGSYWTSNLMTAISSSGTAMKKFGGNRLYISAQINEQSAFADEDSLAGGLTMAYVDTMKQFFPNIVSDAAGLHLASFTADPKMHEQAKLTFAQNLHKHLVGAPQNPIEYPRLGQIFDDYLMRLFAHLGEQSQRHWFRQDLPMPNVPSVEQAEHQFLMDRDWLSKRYRATTFKKNETFNHTLRIATPVGFRGRNRILCIIEDIRNDAAAGKPDQSYHNLHLRYGSVPQEFIEHWQERIGEWQGIVTETKKLRGPKIPQTKNRQNAGVNHSSGKMPGRVAGSGKAMKVKPGFVG